MGKINTSIFGAVSGKVGNVIGASWKSVAYLRGKAAKVKYSNSEEQQTQRAIFKAVVKFVKPMKAFLNIAYKGVETNMTPYNSVTKRILTECIIKGDEGAEIDYSKVLVSKGGMPVLNDITATCSAGKVSLSWSDKSDVSETKISGDDNIMPLVFNLSKQQAEFSTKQFKRSDKSGDLELPESWKGDSILVYAGTKDKKNKDASDSIFLGEFVLA